MDLLKKYIDEVGKDLVLDDFNIKDVQMRLPSRKHFWVARLMEAKIKRSSLDKEKRKLKKDITREVIATSPVKITQNVAEQAAERHDSIQKLTDQIKECDLIVEYLEKVEKVMSQMSFDVKNIIEINKMEQL